MQLSITFELRNAEGRYISLKVKIIVSLIFFVIMSILYFYGFCELDFYVLAVSAIVTGIFMIMQLQISKKLKDIEIMIVNESEEE